MAELCKAAEAALQQLHAADRVADLRALGGLVAASYGAGAASVISAACVAPASLQPWM